LLLKTRRGDEILDRRHP